MTLSAALLERVGWTGLLIAGLRAAESRRPDALVHDPFATALVDLLGDEGNDGATQWMARDGRSTAMSAALGEYLGVRTRYVDDAVVEATTAGAHQVVLLGAGLDARAFRTSLPADTTIFEVDTPDVLEAKEGLLDLAGLTPRVERRRVPADLRGDWPAALGVAGHDPDRPTTWVAEGVLYYLSRADGDALMEDVARRSAPGSRFVTEYPDTDMASFMHLVGDDPAAEHTAGFLSTGPQEAPQTWLPRFGWAPTATPVVRELVRHGRPTPPWALRSDGAGWWFASATRGGVGTERVVSFERLVAAPADRIFALIADPARQPEWDGMDNLGAAASGQRVTGVGDVFSMTLTRGSVRENHVVEFAEGRVIAWRPSEPGMSPPGHLWRWELQPVDDAHTLVRHTYDWSGLTDEGRFERARATTADRLAASLSRLAAVALTRM